MIILIANLKLYKKIYFLKNIYIKLSRNNICSKKFKY